MDRTNIFASHADRRITGWFDYDSVQARWTDLDYNGNGSRGTGRGTGILLTAGGKWVSSSISRWQGETTTFMYATPEQAREWLIANGEDAAVAEHFGLLPEEEDRRPGRPEIGGRYTMTYGDDLLSRLDSYAFSRGVSRAEAVRSLLHQALAAGASEAPRVTDAQIEALRDEAGTAGDLEQAAICDAALGGDTAARAECGHVITLAAAQL